MWKRYLIWISGFVRGNFGESFEYKREVDELIWDRIAFTLVISVGSLIFTYVVRYPARDLFRHASIQMVRSLPHLPQFCRDVNTGVSLGTLVDGICV